MEEGVLPGSGQGLSGLPYLGLQVSQPDLPCFARQPWQNLHPGPVWTLAFGLGALGCPCSQGHSVMGSAGLCVLGRVCGLGCEGWCQEGRGGTAAVRTSWAARSLPSGDGSWDRPPRMQDTTGQHLVHSVTQSPSSLLPFTIGTPAVLGRDLLPTPCSLSLPLVLRNTVFWQITLEAVSWGLGAAAQTPLCSVQSPAPWLGAAFLTSPQEMLLLLLTLRSVQEPCRGRTWVEGPISVCRWPGVTVPSSH